MAWKGLGGASRESHRSADRPYRERRRDQEKEEWADEVWGGARGAERSLTNAIHILRKAFRDRGHDDLIKTIPRRGYRFVGEVSENVSSDLAKSPQVNVIRTAGDADRATALEVQKVRQIELADPGQRTNHRWIVAVGLLVTIFAVAGLTVWNYRDTDKGSSLSDLGWLAVLPLRAAGDEDEGLRMRITDSVITRLSEVETIRVRPTAVVQKYENTTLDPVSAGKELMVDAIFDGTVEIKDTILSVELRAISTRPGEQIWSDRFVGEPDRLLMLQDSISKRILALLRSGTPRFATTLTTLGRYAEALDLLEEGLKRRDDRMLWVKAQPELEALRGEPRYQGILREMKIAY